MPKLQENHLVKTQKLIVALCVLMALFPTTKLAIALHQKDKAAVKRSLLGCAFGGASVGLSVAGYMINRKKEQD